MKGLSWLLIAVLVAALGAGGFIAQQELSGLKSEIGALAQKVESIESFVKSEQELRKATELPPNADLPRVIDSLNRTNQQLAAAEETIKKDVARIDGDIQKQAEAIAKAGADAGTALQKVRFDTLLATIRGHILKIKLDLSDRNVGVVKNELDLANASLANAAAAATEENKKAIEEIRAALLKAKAELDVNLPAASNRIDLLWHDLGKLRK